MTYHITLTLPCGARHVATSLSEARLMTRLGWRFVALRGRSSATAKLPDHAASPAQNPLAQAHWKL